MDQSKWLIARRRRKKNRKKEKKGELNLGTRSKTCLHHPSSKLQVPCVNPRSLKLV
jgi:hypothetical protein